MYLVNTDQDTEFVLKDAQLVDCKQPGLGSFYCITAGSSSYMKRFDLVNVDVSGSVGRFIGISAKQFSISKCVLTLVDCH